MPATALTDETILDFVDQKDKPVMVCFYSSEEDAQYQYDAVIEEIADMQDKVHIGKIDAWVYKEPAHHFNARWFPTCIMFVDGVIKDYCVGEDYAPEVIRRFQKFFD